MRTPTRRVTRFLVLAACAAGLALACGGPPEPETRVGDESSRRSLVQGEVVGYVGDHDDHAWRGIPYARPPVGALRWRAPLPGEPWNGTFEALEQGAPCPQFASALGGPDGERPGEAIGDENCLSVNVFAPRFPASEVPTGDHQLPVMLWIHGGGNTVGSSAFFDGGRLATRHELIIVTVNYRLGAFGWFTHPSLRLEGLDARNLSGNWGTLDLVQALSWTRQNVATFGGDPNNITVFGESAGGTNVFSLLISPAARGRFQRAIVQSGELSTTPIAEAENLRDASVPGHDRSSGEVLLQLFVADGAVDRSAAKIRLASMSQIEIARYLRDKSSDEILAVYDGSGMGGMYRTPGLIRDGYVIPTDEPSELFARADGTADVPTILGTNRDENKLFLLFGSEHVRHVFGLPLWFKNEGAYELTAEYLSQAWKARGVDEPGAAMRRVHNAPLFAYRFDWNEEPKLLWADFSKLLGAAHALEIPFVFGTFDLGLGNRFLWDEDRIPARDALSDAMMSYWANFANTGDPGRGRTGTLEHWKAWELSGPAAPKFLVFDTPEGGGIRMSSDTITAKALRARLTSDSRFSSQRDRCALYRQLAVSNEDYASACGELPMDAYPWDE